jgi:predicted kinase
MKKLFIMRGPSGCGKTTLIKKLGLENNTLSPDKLRIMMSGFEIFGNDTRISQRDSYKVFKELYSILEQRMEYGLLTVIDHTNLYEMNIEKYKVLCNKYGYECIVVNFKKDSLEELKERNKSRTDKYISVEDLEKEYRDAKTQKIPSFCKIIHPEKMEQELNLKFGDISRFKKVIHIGDIHGCNTVLQEAIKDLSFENFYIFTGDYIDRGLENVDVLKFMISIRRKPNVILLKGNHEINLAKYVNGEEYYGRAFQQTRKEIESSDISVRDLKDFCKCLKNYYAYNYQGIKVICTHGGISSMKDFPLVSEYGFVLGSGNIEDIDIDKEFSENEPSIYQVHGHRNDFDVSITQYNNSFNLEGAVEEGGCLRMLELTNKNNFTARTYKNEVFRKEYIKEEED